MKVLVVIDMQKDFVDGALGSPEAQAIVPNVVAKVKEYAEMEDGLVVYTRDTHFADYVDTREGRYLPVPHCIFETEGWEIVPEVLNDQAAVVIFNKETFGYSAIAEEIGYIINGELGQEIDSIEVCGLCTDICVVSNALILKANFPDIPFVVDSSCCAGVTPEKHEAALEVMRSCQIDVI
jgi:nicotinamidase-related amidase